MDYRETLNLPKTKFKMKANLTQREPMVLKQWEKEKLYHKIQQAAADRPQFILHDGPPYANGHIHMGHALNKILKDIIVKSKRMQGYYTPYVPGWDCHGLPIELMVDKKLGKKKRELSKADFRRECREYAKVWIQTQSEEFQRLGIFGDWQDPYLTMTTHYEAATARELAKLAEKGSLFKGKKPIHWCTSCVTALAEAEVEYEDHTSPSIYVRFPLNDENFKKIADVDTDKLFIVIWTTTPWTIPDNLAVAFHPDFEYAAVSVQGEIWILAKELVESCMQLFEITDYSILTTFSASGLEGKYCRHPFMERDSLMVLADYVTAESGTGCVHTAPGHGADDYQTGLRYGLEILSPVDDAGQYTKEAGRYAGEQVPDVNKKIIADMAAEGSLVKELAINHSYPHCWRCKEPVMYRATAQWFIAMENLELRQKALAAINEVSWTPAWGQQRIYGMVEARPDWCLSRQRSWGVPVTVFTCKDCGEILKNESVCEKIDTLFAKEGADAWFKYEVSDFIPEEVSCSCGSKNFQKESDILDVWFDSGTSHAAVLEERDELYSPADLYLEGSDQHRGWFQSSLLTSVGTRGRAPYKGVLTHGYVVDGQGKKMSKSVGNVVAPQEVIDKYGAEVLRLWVSSENYQDDVKVSDEILKHVSDAYRKMRNTLRFLLSNLYDFNPETDSVGPEALQEIDRWALSKFAQVSRRVTLAYERYEFHAIYHALHNFCGTTVSSIYMDVLKDRLYCSLPAGPERRAAQTVIYRILDGLLRLMSPILCFTTAEAWEHLHGLAQNAPLEQSIFFASFAVVDDVAKDDAFDEQWNKLLNLRSGITRVLEAARRDKVIGLGLDAEVTLKLSDEWKTFLEDRLEQLQELCIVSSLRLDAGKSSGLSFVVDETIPGVEIAVAPAPGNKCERCWTISTTVGEDQEHPALCARCSQVVRQLTA